MLPSFAVLGLLVFFTALLHAETDEEKLGREVANELIKTFGVLDEPLAQRKMEAMVDVFLQVSGERDVEPKVFVLNTSDVNAVSLPGGYIFVNNGLLGFVDNDDELAAVLAHELAHSLKKHAWRMSRTGQRVGLQSTFWALALSLVTGKEEGIPYLLQAASAYATGKMAGYTLEMEKEADRYAAFLLNRSPYSSYGLVTFLEKLAIMERQRPKWQLGILKTHPSSDERVRSAYTLVRKDWSYEMLMEKRYFHVERRDHESWIFFDNIPLFQPRQRGDFETAEDRSKFIVARANALLSMGLDFRNGRLRFQRNSVEWIIGQHVVFRIYADELGEQWKEKARKLWNQVRRTFLKAYLSTIK